MALKPIRNLSAARSDQVLSPASSIPTAVTFSQQRNSLSLNSFSSSIDPCSDLLLFPLASPPSTLVPVTYLPGEDGQQNHESESSSGIEGAELSLDRRHRIGSAVWGLEDDRRLIGARLKGFNWGQIKDAHFPSKTANACRKRHERLMERRRADDWDTKKLQRLAREYMAMRREIWSGLAARTGERWNIVEQKVGRHKHELLVKQRGTQAVERRDMLKGAARAASRRQNLETAMSYDDEVHLIRTDVGQYHETSPHCEGLATASDMTPSLAPIAATTKQTPGSSLHTRACSPSGIGCSRPCEIENPPTSYFGLEECTSNFGPSSQLP